MLATETRRRPLGRTIVLGETVVTVVGVDGPHAAKTHIGFVDHRNHALDNIKHFSSSRTSGVSTSPARSANTAIS